MVELVRVIPYGLSEAAKAGHDTLNRLELHLIESADNDNVYGGFLFRVELHKRPLKIPHFGVWDALHIRVENDLDI